MTMTTKTKSALRAIFSLALIAGLAALLFAPIRPSVATPKIITTIFPAYDIAKNVLSGTDFSPNLLISPGTDLHDYEPAPQDIIAIQNADLIIYNGGATDAWLEEIISANATKIRMIDAISPLESSDDEHFWTAPQNVVKITTHIGQVLAEKYPQNAPKITKNAQNYAQKFEKLDQDFSALAEITPKPTIILADSFPFTYFNQNYNFNFKSALDSCDHDAEPSASTISDLINTINSEHLTTIFTLDTLNTKITQPITSATGAKTQILYSGEAVSAADFATGRTLYDLYTHNLSTIQELYDANH